MTDAPTLHGSRPSRGAGSRHLADAMVFLMIASIAAGVTPYTLLMMLSRDLIGPVNSYCVWTFGYVPVFAGFINPADFALAMAATVAVMLAPQFAAVLWCVALGPLFSRRANWVLAALAVLATAFIALVGSLGWPCHYDDGSSSAGGLGSFVKAAPDIFLIAHVRRWWGAGASLWQFAGCVSLIGILFLYVRDLIRGLRGVRCLLGLPLVLSVLAVSSDLMRGVGVLVVEPRALLSVSTAHTLLMVAHLVGVMGFAWHVKLAWRAAEIAAVAESGPTQ